MELTFRKCPVCDNIDPTKWAFVSALEKVNRIQCKICGVIYFDKYTFPTPTYDYKYNKHFLRPGDIRKAGIFAALLAEEAYAIHKNPKILEIGPGNAITTMLLHAMNIKMEIVDACTETVTRMLTNYGIKGYSGAFEFVTIQEKYDVIYAGHVLEHTDHAHKFFLNAYKCLNKGGRFIFDTPDSKYASVHGMEWKHFHTRDAYEHCLIHSERSITKLATALGFKIISIERLTEFESLLCTLERP